jgi:hypothetical protein
MSVSNILDKDRKIRPEYIPTAVADKVKAIEECLYVLMEVLAVDGYTYTGKFQGVATANTTATSSVDNAQNNIISDLMNKINASLGDPTNPG